MSFKRNYTRYKNRDNRNYDCFVDFTKSLVVGDNGEENMTLKVWKKVISGMQVRALRHIKEREKINSMR